MPEGMLERPHFGELPPRGVATPRWKFRYAPILETMRSYPGQPACIAIFEKGPATATYKSIRSAHSAVYHWLQKNYPREAWEVHMRRIKDTWSRRELWVVYHGVLTVEQARELRDARVKLRQVRKYNAEQRRAANEVRLRMLALAKQAEDANAE